MFRIADSLRQLGYPRELRIADPGLEPLAVSVDELLAQLLGGELPGSSEGGPEPPRQLDPSFVRRLANAAWRLELQTVKLPADEVGEWVRTRMEVLSDMLRAEGIETIDSTGQPYDPGEIWDDVIGTPTEKLHPIISAMREPRILYQGSMIARGTPIITELNR